MAIKRLAIILTLIAILNLTACDGFNMAVADTTYKFDKAIIFLPNGEKIEGTAELWLDFENSDMIQVKIDGKWYLTHSTNVILINE